jgi:hypothetical protein
VRELTKMKKEVIRLDLEAEIPAPEDDILPLPDVEVSSP